MEMSFLLQNETKWKCQILGEIDSLTNIGLAALVIGGTEPGSVQAMPMQGSQNINKKRSCPVAEKKPILWPRCLE